MTSMRKRKVAICRQMLAPWACCAQEDLLWDRVPPIGSEFGSPDFGCLMEEDSDSRNGVCEPLLQESILVRTLASAGDPGGTLPKQDRRKRRSTEESETTGRERPKSESDNRTLVFLDIDGVLHRQDGPWFERLPVLVKWLKRNPQVHLVLSSSHREGTGSRKLRDALPLSLRARLVGQTPILARSRLDPPIRFIRQLEIEAYLRTQNDAPVRHAVIDDDPSLFSPGWPCLASCDGERGLTRDVLAEVDRILERDQPGMASATQGTS